VKEYAALDLQPKAAAAPAARMVRTVAAAAPTCCGAAVGYAAVDMLRDRERTAHLWSGCSWLHWQQAVGL
jgi:hypothetical protein